MIGQPKFPFLGAGIVQYFDAFELMIQFIRPVSRNEQTKMVSLIPCGLNNCEVRFNSSMLRITKERYIGGDVQRCYGKKSHLRPSYEHEELWCHAGAARAFERQLLQWLDRCNKINPIVVVFRRPEIDLKQVKFSPLHKWSIYQVRVMVENWIAQPALVSNADNPFFRLMMSGITTYVKFKPRVQLEIYKRYALDRLIEYYLYLGKKAKLVRLFTEHSHSDFAFRMLATGFNRYKTSDRRNLSLIAEILPFLARDSRFPNEVLPVSMEYNHYLFEALHRKKNMLLIERLTRMLLVVTRSVQNNAVHDLYVSAEEYYKPRHSWSLAIILYDICITILSQTKIRLSDETFYCNALWILQRDNTKLAVNKKLNLKFLKVCLPDGKNNPAIFFNAACLYAEMHQPQKAFKFIKLAIKSGIEDDELDGLVKDTLKHRIFTDVRKQTDVLNFLRTEKLI